MEIRDRDGASRAVGPQRLDGRVERAHRHRHVAGVRRDAGVARTDDRVLPVHAIDGRAAAAGPALVAGHVGVVEIRAARALKQVPGGRRLVAQLARCAGKQRTRQQAVVAPHGGMRRQVGVAYQCADPQAAVIRRLDAIEAQTVHVDQVCRRLDLQLHQVKQVGAAGDEASALPACRGSDGLRGRTRPFVAEAFHAFAPAFPPATSVIASTMLL